ncbi:MAG: succinate dehydrogenase assembly factor 2 [Candidatus Wenzhouxiangella sp. M2_3B_020]
MSDPDSVARSRLRWHCRRGMRELDRLLERWLDRRWPEASEDERETFERMLAFEDDRLWDWMTGRSRPDDADLATIVDQVAHTGER